MNAKTRIAIIAGRDPLVRDDTDGGSVFLGYLASQISTAGARADIFLPLGVAGGRYSEERAAEQRGPARPSLPGVTFRYVPVASGRNRHFVQSEDYFIARLDRAKAFAASFSAHAFDGYDVVYILHVANAHAFIESGLLPLSKTVLFPMMTSANYDEFSFVPGAYAAAERAVFNTIRHICSPSDDEIHRIRERFGVPHEKLFKVHRGFDPHDFPPQDHAQPDGDQLTLICANGIRPQKDHLFLIPVVEALRSDGWRVRVHLTGNNGRSHNPLYNAYTERFWRTVSDRGLKESFTAHDIVNRSALVALMKESHVAVYASKSETFGKSALESAASGLPTIVCDDVPAFTEFITDGVTGIRAPRQADAFAARITAFARDPVVYGALCNNGLGLRERFTWPAVMRDLARFETERGILKKTSIRTELEGA